MQAPTCSNYNAPPALIDLTRDTPITTKTADSCYLSSNTSMMLMKKKNVHGSVLVKNGNAPPRQGGSKCSPAVSKKVSAYHAAASRIDAIIPGFSEDVFLALTFPQFSNILDNRHSRDVVRLEELHLSLDAFSDSSDSIDIVGLPASEAFDIATILDSPKLSDNHCDVGVGNGHNSDDAILGKTCLPLQDDLSLALSLDHDDVSLSSDTSDLVDYLLDSPRQQKNHDVEEDNDRVELPPAGVSDLVGFNVGSADEISLSDDLDLSFDEDLVL